MPSAHHDVVLGQRLARMVREQHEHVTKDALGGSVKLKIRERPCQAHAVHLSWSCSHARHLRRQRP